MRLAAVAVMVLALTVGACQSSPTANTMTPSPETTTSPNTGASPTPSPTASAVAFSCRLPVTVDNSTEGRIEAGFLDTRSGRITIDPNAVNGLFYDRRHVRWLPVRPNGVSPDGSHYAIAGGTNDFKPILHIVDIGSGAEQVYPLPDALTIGLAGPVVLGYAMKSIYIGEPTEVGMEALWIFDLTTHQTAFVDMSGLGIVDGTTAWRSTKDPADEKASPAPGFVPGASQIDRVDLVSGKDVVWLHEPGHQLSAIAIDGSHNPILSAFDKQTAEVLVLKSPSTVEVAFRGSVDDWPAYVSQTYVDSHGVWFGTEKGVYLYSSTGVLTKVTDEPASPAGDCQDQS